VISYSASQPYEEHLKTFTHSLANYLFISRAYFISFAAQNGFFESIVSTHVPHRATKAKNTHKKPVFVSRIPDKRDIREKTKGAKKPGEAWSGSAGKQGNKGSGLHSGSKAEAEP